jgi:hypothetical protein
MEAEIKAVAGSLLREVRKDLPFFGACGFAVGLLMLAQYRLSKNGITPKDSWPDALFSDFVSFNAFGLVFVGLLALGALVTCLAALNIGWHKLEQVVAHLEERLAQLASSIISFTLGLSTLALLHSGYTSTAGGAALAVMVVLFDCLLVVGFVSAALVARRKPPFDRWWFGVVFLTLAVAGTLWFIFRGVK